VALGGWATRQERFAYERIARKYRPDLVLLGVCLNDLPELHNNLARPWPVIGGLYRRSALVRWAVGAQAREIRDIEELFREREAPRVRAAFRGFFAEVDDLRRAVKQDGAELALVVFPFQGQVTPAAPAPSVQEEIASFCRAREIPFLDLRPALSLKARVAYVKQLPKGDSAGYNRAYMAKEDVWVATLPVGHTDGLPREAAPRVRVRINGALYPIVATVSASHCIVEIGSEPRVKIGDEAAIFDWQEGSRPEDVNEACKASVYDLTMHLNPLLPRRIVS